MTRIFVGLCTLILTLVFTPALTRADPLVVTDGSITVTGLIGGPLGNLTGDNFAVGIGGSLLVCPGSCLIGPEMRRSVLDLTQRRD